MTGLARSYPMAYALSSPAARPVAFGPEMILGADLFGAPGRRTRKVLLTSSATSFWVCTADETGRGWVAQRVEMNNVLSGAGDLGGAQEVWRRTNVWVIREALVCNNTSTAQAGTWTSANLNSTTNPYGYGGDAVLRTIASTHTATSGDYVEYTVAVDQDGRFTILLQDRTGLSPAGAQNVVVTDAGSTAISTFAADSGTPGLRQVVLTHPTKRSTTFVCRIAKGSGSGRLTVIGVNSVLLTRPNDPMPSGVNYTFDAFIRRVADVPFIDHDGAQDYAFRDFAAQRTGGSVHGGERRVYLAAALDGAAFSLPGRGAGTEFWIRQRSLIDFTGFGGGTIAVDAIRDFTIDGRPRQVFDIRGEAVMSTAYLGMTTGWVAFKEIKDRFRTVPDATAGTGDIDPTRYLFDNKDPQTLHVDPATGNNILSESSAVLTYPRFEKKVFYYFGPPSQPIATYVKRWNMAIDEENRPLNTARFVTADSYRIAA